MGRSSPSWSHGFRGAVELWRVVLAVFVVTLAVFLPTHLALWTTVGGALASLPDGDLPDGELAIVAVEVLRPVWPALLLTALAGWFALWAWNVLWHAGVVRWLADSSRTEVRLTAILGRGVAGWWRWARLGLTSLAVLAATHAAVAASFRALQRHARDSADDSRMAVTFVVAVACSAVAVVLCWLATLHGSWLLGSGTRRSAVLAWLAGLWGAVRQPVRSLAVLVLWVVPGVATATLPLVAGWRFEALRAPVGGAVISTAAGLLAAFCWVGLFLSFAPGTGPAGEGSPEGS